MNKLDDFVIRGSSTGIVRNSEFMGASDVGCPRKTILRHLEIQQPISNKTKEVFAIGALFEEYWAKENPDYVREREILTPGFKGHCDFSNASEIVETKSVTSKNTHREVFKNGTPKIQNAIQLLSYMLALEIPRGRLIYGSYTHICTYDKMMKMRTEEIAPLFKDAIPVMKEFLVEIDSDGNALVDGEPFHNIHVSELIEFQDNLHELVRQRVLPPRIESLEPGAWSGPCKFCPLQTLCDSGVSDLEEFVETASEIFLLTDENR